MYRQLRSVTGVLVVAALLAGTFGLAPARLSHASAREHEGTPAAAIEPPPVEEPPATGESATEDEQPPPEVTEESDEATAPPLAQPPVTDPSQAQGDEAAGDPPPPDETAAAPPAAAAPVAPDPVLNYALAGQPDCRPAGEQPEIVAHGGYLDYDCTVAVQLSGAHLAPAAVQLDWTVAASVDGGWSAQLLPPVLDPNAPSDWTAEGGALAEFAHQGGIGDGATIDPVDTFETTTTLTFGLRAHRVACGTEAQPVTVDVAVAASLPGYETATIQDAGIEPEPYQLNPELAPIPEPSIAFGGSLNFGEVQVDATGVLEPPAPQTIDVTVSGLDQACGDWAVGLNTTTLGSADGSAIAASTLNLVSIDDEALAGGGCPLEDGCEVALLNAGAEAAPATTFTLGVSLVLPDQPRATTFNSTLTATLAEANS
ncbi:MAG: hypothetical protein ACRDJH_07785 [Thermomicrobiales bacterium]